MKEGADPNDARNWEKADPDCPFNQMKVPQNKGKPIHKCFEDFSKNQDLWIKRIHSCL